MYPVIADARMSASPAKSVTRLQGELRRDVELKLAGVTTVYDSQERTATSELHRHGLFA